MQQGLARLWRDGLLCDCVVKTDDGGHLPAHKVCLAAASGYFRAAFLGAGCYMRGNAASKDNLPVVRVPDTTVAEVHCVLECIYQGHAEIGSDNLEGLLRVSSFLEVPLVLEACCAFMRQALSLTTAVPLLMMAARYGCVELKAELLTYVCSKFSSLVHAHSTTATVDRQISPPAAIQQASYQQSHGRPYDMVPDPWASSNAIAGSSWPVTNGRDTLNRISNALSKRQSDAGCLETQTQPARGTSSTTTPLLVHLPKDLLLELLHSDELSVDCEMDVLQAIVDWIAYDARHRSSDLKELLAAVRAEQIPATASSILATRSKTQVHTEVASAAQRALQGNNLSVVHPVDPILSTLKRPLYTTCNGRSTPTPTQPGALKPTAYNLSTAVTRAPADLIATQAQLLGNSGHRRRRMQATKLVAAGGHDSIWRSLKSTEYYDPVTDTWEAGPGMQVGLSFAAAGVVDREVVVVGGTPHWSCVSRLSGGNNGWMPGANLPSPRAHSGVVTCGNTLFVLGGRSQVQAVQHVLPSLEVLCEGRGSSHGSGVAGWRSGPDMSVPRCALAVAALHGALYAIGGQTGKLTLRTVECFDVGSERWMTLPTAELRQERKYAAYTAYMHQLGQAYGVCPTLQSLELEGRVDPKVLQAVSLDGRIYLVGGMDEARNRSACVDAFDPREGRWQALAGLSSARSSAGLAALQLASHGRVYVVGGNGANDTIHDTVEMYMPEMNQWVPAAPLGVGRSGLALCAA